MVVRLIRRKVERAGEASQAHSKGKKRATIYDPGAEKPRRSASRGKALVTSRRRADINARSLRLDQLIGELAPDNTLLARGTAVFRGYWAAGADRLGLRTDC
jgi:hypothetical protein